MRNVKKILAVLLGTIVVIAAGGVAFAFWTTTGGTGAGTADTGESAGVTVNQTSTVTAMGPGVAPQDLSGDFDNTSDATVYVTSVTASIDSVTLAGAGACGPANYDIANAVSTVEANVPAGNGVGSWGTTDTPTIEFVNSVQNQDDCQGATVNLEYVAD